MYMYVYVCMYVCMFVYVCMYVCMYVRTYDGIYIRTPRMSNSPSNRVSNLEYLEENE